MRIDLENNFSYGSKLHRRNFIQYSTVNAGGLMLSPILSQARITFGDTPAASRCQGDCQVKSNG